MRLLTKSARQKTEKTGWCIAPAAAESAKIEVDDATLPSPDHKIAHVPTRWIDQDESGKPRIDKATWVCRLEPDGWRVAGYAAFVFEGEDPLMIDLEDPDDMAKKQKWLREEIERRGRESTKSENTKPALPPEKG